MATYAISDVHGCLGTLKTLLDTVSPTSADDVWILGDMCDRGEQSAEALMWAVDEAPENVHFLLGNHEAMLRDEATDDVHVDLDNGCWYFNGGIETAAALKEKTDREWRQMRLLPWVRSLKPWTLVTANGQDTLLVHAGFDLRAIDERACAPECLEDLPRKTRNIYNVPYGFWTQREDVMVWIRFGWIDNDTELPVPVVFGHTQTRSIAHMARHLCDLLHEDTPAKGTWISDALKGEPDHIIRHKNSIAIDCGCVYGGNLACLRLEDGQETYAKGVER